VPCDDGDSSSDGDDHDDNDTFLSVSERQFEVRLRVSRARHFLRINMTVGA
jgi:hypothetical protein